MEKYRCRDCGCRFDEETAGQTREWIGEDNYSSNSSGWMYWMCCPKCGGDDFEETQECDCCGESYIPDDDMICVDDFWYCQKCAGAVVIDYITKWGMDDENVKTGIDRYEKRVAKMKVRKGA